MIMLQKNRSHRYVPVVIDIFSNFGWADPLKTKDAQTVKDSFENILKSSNRKLNLIKTDDGSHSDHFIASVFVRRYFYKWVVA